MNGLHHATFINSHNSLRMGVATSGLAAKGGDTSPAMDPECSICLSDNYSPFSKIELDCGHSYHRDCILRWARQSSRCPMCRAPLDDCLLEILVIRDNMRLMFDRVEASHRIRARRLRQYKIEVGDASLRSPPTAPIQGDPFGGT